MSRILQYAAKKAESIKYRVIEDKAFIEKFFHSMLLYNLAKYGADNQ